MVILTEPSEIVVLASVRGAQMEDLLNLQQYLSTARQSMIVESNFCCYFSYYLRHQTCLKGISAVGAVHA